MATVTGKWNVFDIMIHRAEMCIERIKKEVNDSKDEVPEPEVMIKAATEYLQKENKQLKDRLYPEKLIIKYGNYYCPECHEQLLPATVKKFCPECGKRIILYKSEN